MAERKNGQPRRVYGHKEEASCRTWCSGADRGHLALGQEVTQLGPLRWGQLAGCKQQQTHRVHENNNHTVCREINGSIDELTSADPRFKLPCVLEEGLGEVVSSLALSRASLKLSSSRSKLHSQHQSNQQSNHNTSKLAATHIYTLDIFFVIDVHIIYPISMRPDLQSRLAPVPPGHPPPLLPGGGGGLAGGGGAGGGRGGGPGGGLSVQVQGGQLLDQLVQAALLLVDDEQVVGQGGEEGLAPGDHHVPGWTTTLCSLM